MANVTIESELTAFKEVVKEFAGKIGDVKTNVQTLLEK